MRAEFDNTTGDPVFDGTLRQGLSVQLEQSPFLSILPERKRASGVLPKNQRHIASDVFQQLLASDANLGTKLYTLKQVDEQTASHLC